jgi:DDE superfamily endonuclease
VYGAVEPTTGENYFRELPPLNTANFQSFLQECAAYYRETLTIGLLDHGRCHQATSLAIPHQVIWLFLPPDRPELNPIERLGQDLKAQLAWVLAPQIEKLADDVVTRIRHSSKAAIHSLTAYPSVVQAAHALSS